MVIEDIKEGINDTLEDLFCLLALEQDILKRYEKYAKIRKQVH